MEKVILITGGSRGIGKSIAEKFISERYKVIAPTRLEMDLEDNCSIEKYCNNIEINLDAIINCAGINRIAELNKLVDSDLLAMLQVDLLAPLKIIKCLNEQMGRGKVGRIVNISSIWSYVSKEGRCGYTAAKSALNGITRTLALEFAESNILVNSVAPGFVNTELTRINNTPEEVDKISSVIPMKRLAEPEEIANLVFFLASDMNTYITGQTILIDGGYTCK